MFSRKNAYPILIALGILVGLGSPANSADLEIERHETAGVIDLVPGADRGTITQPLLKGTLFTNLQEVLFVITDASDKDFSRLLGAIQADALAEASADAVELED